MSSRRRLSFQLLCDSCRDRDLQMLLHTYGACEQQAHAACSRAPVSHACAACLRQTLGPHSHSHICGIASLAHVCLPGPIHHVPSAAATTSRTFCTATGRNHWRPSLSALTRQGRTPSQAMAVGTFQVSSLLFQLEVRRARGVAVAASQRCIRPATRASGTRMCRMSPCSHACAATPSMQLAALAAFSLRMQRACRLKRFLVPACPAG